MSAEEIRAARLKMGLTQEEFGQRLGVHQSRISRWERVGEPDIRTIYAIRWLLHVHESEDPGASR